MASSYCILCTVNCKPVSLQPGSEAICIGISNDPPLAVQSNSLYTNDKNFFIFYLSVVTVPIVTLKGKWSLKWVSKNANLFQTSYILYTHSFMFWSGWKVFYSVAQLNPFIPCQLCLNHTLLWNNLETTNVTPRVTHHFSNYKDDIK